MSPTTVSGSRGKAFPWRMAVAAFGLSAVYFTGVFPPSKNPNELSRIQAIVAFVDHGTFAIDGLLEKYGDHEDKSVYGGHAYSNKAPGLAFAGIVVYRALRIFWPEPSLALSPIFITVRILTVSVIALLALARLGRRLAREPFGDRQGVVTAALALGTPFLFYGRSFFSHAWTASLLFLAWDAVKSAEDRAAVSRSRMVVAGFLAGWAMISEYTAAPVAILLAARAFSARRYGALMAFVLGMLPPLVLLLAYNRACFGSPWSLSSAHEALPAYSEAARHGVFGVGPPSSRAILGLLFGSSRGTILFSPFWLWVVPGFLAWWKSGKARWDCAFAAASVLVLFMIVSGYSQWEGGHALGSRYLLPVTFFAALGVPFALCTSWSRRLFAVAASYSVAHFFLLTASWPYISPTFRWPVANVAWWSLANQWVAPNVGQSLGLPPLWSLLIPGLAVAAALWSSAVSWADAPRGATVAAVFAGVGALAVTIACAPGISAADAATRAWLFHFLRP